MSVTRSLRPLDPSRLFGEVAERVESSRILASIDSQSSALRSRNRESLSDADLTLRIKDNRSFPRERIAELSTFAAANVEVEVQGQDCAWPTPRREGRSIRAGLLHPETDAARIGQRGTDRLEIRGGHKVQRQAPT